MTSSTCEAVDVGDEDAGDGAGGLQVLGGMSIATEPSQGALDHPTAGDYLEALCGVGTADNFNGSFSKFGVSAALSFLPAYAPSAKRWRSQG